MGIHALPNDTSNLKDPIWEKQEGESIKYYRYFIIFSGIKPSERTIAEAWRRAMEGNANKVVKKPSIYFRQLSKKWCWTERAAARDIWEVQNSQSRWIERDRDRREANYQIGQEFVDYAMRIMKSVKNQPIVANAIDAKDLAVAGAALQESSIPTMQLAQDQMAWVLKMLPPDKRDSVIAKLQQRKTQRLLAASKDNGDVVEGEAREI